MSSEKITIGSEVGKKVNCSMCQKEGTTDQFVTMQNNKGQDIYLCSECKEKANQHFQKETENPNILLAIVLGLVGGAIGGAIWYLVAIVTEMEIGYISLGLGYLVGFGVHFGSGKKYGVKLQVISAIIAVVAIIITELFVTNYFYAEDLQIIMQENGITLADLEANEVPASISILNPEFWKILVSPMGLLIYAIGVYLAFNFCKPRKI